MKKESVLLNKNMVIIALIILFVFNDQDLFAQSLATKMSSQVNEIWGWAKIICGVAVVLVGLIGAVVVYGKTTGENPQSFMTAALGWFKGLAFICLALGLIGGLKLILDASTSGISF